MGTKYTSQSISGYNASPPPDDGSKVSANVLKWSNHISKIGNPIKALAEAINSALVTHLDRGPAVAKTANYVTTTADHNTVIPFDDTGLTCSLLAPATAGAGYQVTIKNLNSDALTVDVSGGANIDSASSVSVLQDESFTFIVNDDSTAYYAESAHRDLDAAVPAIIDAAYVASVLTTAGVEAVLSNGYVKFAANDEFLWRGDSVPAGFTTVASTNKAIRLNSSASSATADGGSLSFTAVHTSALSTTQDTHSHTAGTLTVPLRFGRFDDASGDYQPYVARSGSGGTAGANVNVALNGSTDTDIHSHTVNTNVQYRDYRAIKKT